MAHVALGTQTAGSVIRPASYCGVYGLKPTFGTVPVAGVKLVAPSLDTVGWFSRSVATLDAALVVLTGRPPLQQKSIPQGAATSVWAGAVASADEVGGRYCEDCQVAEVVVAAAGPTIPWGVRAYALDAEHAKALWAKSEEMVGERF